MKVKVFKSTLHNMIKMVLPVVGKSNLPVVEMIRLETAGGLLTAAGTNLEQSILAQGSAVVDMPGGICAPARILSELVASMDGAEVELFTDSTNTMLVLRCGGKSTLRTLPAEEFPPIAKHCYEGTEVDAQQLVKAVQLVGWAASTEEGRPTLQAIQCTGSVMAATDGFRISIIPFEGLMGLIPAKALRMVASLCKDAENIMVRMEGENRAIFTGAGWQLATQLIDGNFPDYNVIIPKHFKTKADVSISGFKTGLAQVKAIGSGRVSLSITDRATLAGETEDGNDVECVAIAAVTGPEQVIHFNAQYLREAVQAAGTKLILSINDGKSPAMIEGDTDGWKHVLMPVHKG